MVNNDYNINGPQLTNTERTVSANDLPYNRSEQDLVQIAILALQELRDQNLNEFDKRNVEYPSATDDDLTAEIGKNKLLKSQSTDNVFMEHKNRETGIHSNEKLPKEQVSEFGIVHYSGKIYKGAVQNGIPHGRGEYTFKTGDWIKGEFQKGIFFKGTGKLTNICGKRNVYEGEIKSASPYKGIKFHGQGKMTYPNGVVIPLKDGKRVSGESFPA